MRQDPLFVVLRDSCGLHHAAFAGLKCGELLQLGAYGDPGRDPRGHYITVAYIGFVPMEASAVKGADDAADAKWWSVRALPEQFAFDHRAILRDAFRRVSRGVGFGDEDVLDLLPAAAREHGEAVRRLGELAADASRALEG